MDLLTAVTHIFADILIFIGAMAALFVVFVLVAIRLPSGSPLKRVVVALCYRVAAMLGAGIIAVPVEPIPGLDVAYDVTAAVGLAIYWITFFISAARILAGSRAQSRRSSAKP